MEEMAKSHNQEDVLHMSVLRILTGSLLQGNGTDHEGRVTTVFYGSVGLPVYWRCVWRCMCLLTVKGLSTVNYSHQNFNIYLYNFPLRYNQSCFKYGKIYKISTYNLKQRHCLGLMVRAPTKPLLLSAWPHGHLSCLNNVSHINLEPAICTFKR